MKNIAIFSVPRSGSTWLGQILNSSPNVLYKFQPNIAYSFEYSLTENSTPKEIESFLVELELTKDPFVNAEISISSKPNILFPKKEMDTLVFKETHYLNVVENLLKNGNVKVIGLIRSPYATINSWLKTPKEFNPDWDIRSQWINADLKNKGGKHMFFGYNKWKEGYSLFKRLEKLYKEKFKIVFYENLVAKTNEETKEIFNFCELSLGSQTLKFLKESKEKDSTDSYSVYKKKSDDLQWREELPLFIRDQIRKDLEINNLFYDV